MEAHSIYSKIKKITSNPYLVKLLSDFFIISFITYLVYLLLEVFVEGLISNYFNLNFLLIFVLMTGLLNLVIQKSKTLSKPVEEKSLNLITRVFFAIIIALVIIYKLNLFGLISILVAVITAILILLI